MGQGMAEWKDQLDRLHTTKLGAERIRRNLALSGEEDIVAWCRHRIAAPGTVVRRQGKNWYVHAEGIVFTVNAASFTIITAHREKRNPPGQRARSRGGTGRGTSGTLGNNKNC